MYAVIFRAHIRQLDEDYLEMARQLRQLALEKYGCTEFTSVSEGGQEIAISYWPELDNINRWKNNLLHLTAQQLGRDKWYRDYRVEVVELIREYRVAARD